MAFTLNKQQDNPWKDSSKYNQEEVDNGFMNGQQTELTPDENGWLHDKFYDAQLNGEMTKDLPDWYRNSILKDAHNDFLKYRNEMYGNSSDAVKKAGGQFYTPPTLALQMLRMSDDYLPDPSKFQDVESYKKAAGAGTHPLFDPTAGAGSLLVPALLGGYDPKLVYALEEDPNKIGILRKRLKALGVPDKNIFMGSATSDATVQKIARKSKNDPYLLKKVAQLQAQNEPTVVKGKPEVTLKSEDEYKKNLVDNLDLYADALPNSAKRYLKEHIDELGLDGAFKFIKDNLQKDPLYKMSH